MSRSDRFDVLGLGCTAVDDLVFVPAFPAEDAKVQALRRERHCGGLTATALVAAARLGARTAYAGVLGDDPDSRFVVETLMREGVDVRSLVRRRGTRPVRSVIIVCPATGSRTILYDVEAVQGADPRRPEAATIEASRVLLVDRWGVPGMIRAARLARRVGRPVVGDFETFNVPQFAELLELADHVIVSESFARRYTKARTPGEGARRLWRDDREAVIVTAGRQGCWVYTGQPGPARRVPAFAVEAVDTTGCGDVFHGAYAAALARGLELEERIRVASGAAALKATRAGGQAGIPTAQELDRFLALRGS